MAKPMQGPRMRARMPNTGSGNYPASRVNLKKGDITKGLQGIPKLRFPNKWMTENGYKKGLRKIEEK